jgi:hypothetical protein
MAILSGVGARALGIITQPRATFEAVTKSPRWLAILVLTSLVTAAAGAIVLETDIGQLALLDQWERTASAFGRPLSDAEYTALAGASGNGAGYAAMIALATGPILVIALSAVLFFALRSATPPTVTFRQVLAVVAHAGVILALRQLVAAPVTYVSETLTSPITLGMFFRVLNEASPLARFFGIIDLFVVWWVFVLAIGMSVLYRRPARRLAGVFVGAYVTLAIALTVAMAATGGTA